MIIDMIVYVVERQQLCLIISYIELSSVFLVA